MTTDDATAQVRGWFTGRLPEGWFTGAPVIVRDREEIAVLGTLPDPPADTPDAERPALIEGLARRFRRRPASGGSRSPGRPSAGSGRRCPGAWSAAARL
ncbi:hypothetical protein ACFQQB_17295 [Nonomuraea rubra]|uniref:hypothetical protein n=1 Tax=Nonomuraea rubra TaxID=46180 RepID=UPI00361479A5